MSSPTYLKGKLSGLPIMSDCSTSIAAPKKTFNQIQNNLFQKKAFKNYFHPLGMCLPLAGLEPAVFGLGDRRLVH